MDPTARLDQLFNTKLFDRLRAEKTGFQSRVKAMAGDIEKPMLGLSVDDQDSLINEVTLFYHSHRLTETMQAEIVFHCAATVRFDEELTKSVAMNVGAVAAIIKLAKRMENLEVRN